MGGGCSCKLTPSGLPNRRLHRCSRTLLSDESVSKRLLLLLAPSRPRNSPRTFFKCTDSSPLFSSRSMVQAIHSLGTEKPEMVHAELWCACLEVNSGHSSPAPESCIISWQNPWQKQIPVRSRTDVRAEWRRDHMIRRANYDVTITLYYITHIRLKIARWRCRRAHTFCIKDDPTVGENIRS